MYEWEADPSDFFHPNGKRRPHRRSRKVARPAHPIDSSAVAPDRLFAPAPTPTPATDTPPLPPPSPPQAAAGTAAQKESGPPDAGEGPPDESEGPPDKCLDVTAFNRWAERQFLHLLEAKLNLSGPDGVITTDLLADAAYRLDLSIETTRRYLLKHTAPSAPYQVVKGRIRRR